MNRVIFPSGINTSWRFQLKKDDLLISQIPEFLEQIRNSKPFPLEFNLTNKDNTTIHEHLTTQVKPRDPVGMYLL